MLILSTNRDTFSDKANIFETHIYPHSTTGNLRRYSRPIRSAPVLRTIRLDQRLQTAILWWCIRLFRQTTVHDDHDLADHILDTALQRAEQVGWESVTLHDIALALGISLQQIRQFYPQKDDLVEAWFDRADDAMLSLRPDAEFAALTAHQRVYRVMTTWLATLAPHRRITRQMLAYKLEPGHFHLQAMGIMRISRTVQWFREAALLQSRDLRRIQQEIFLTAAYLSSFSCWLFDDSANSRRSKDHLKSALKRVPGLRDSATLTL